MVYFNKKTEPALFSNIRKLFAHNQCYSYHNYLFDQLQKLENDNKTALDVLFKLNKNTATNMEDNHLLLKLVSDLTKNQLSEKDQIENIELLENEILSLLKPSQIEIVQLLRNLTVGKSVNSITVRGQHIPVKKLIKYDKDTDLVTFINSNEEVIIVSAYQIIAITFPTV